MQNSNEFFGQLASDVTRPNADKDVYRFSLISNEYAGKDAATGESVYRKVTLQFVAFKQTGQRIQSLAMKGDQMLVRFSIQNNDYEKDGRKVYSYSFIVNDFELGAPGKLKRQKQKDAESQEVRHDAH